MADLASAFFDIIGKVNASNRKSGSLHSSPDSSFDDLDKRDDRVLHKKVSSTSRQAVTNSLPLPNSATEVHFPNMPKQDRINDQVVLQVNGNSKNDNGDDDDSMDMINVSQRSINSCKATDDDIYDDLESSIFALGTKEDRITNSDLQEKLVQAEEKIRSLLQENTKLTKENKNYCKNISSLEITARSEIKKKNFIIQQLQSKLQSMTTTLAKKSNLTKGEVEEILRQCHEAHIEANSEVLVKEIKNKCLLTERVEQFSWRVQKK
ncbi:uncharacterized protein LOC110842190 isoform X2 [Folsomia candida]|uniref:uncharacterized protein LOC110842190 isoform X2 n=1 Tax=Folsomia candida TaxID=158441 RepID=UPI000B9078B2|nr:uncharacterized protein LOC110842190 isoform X2 [Folsomia candida]